MKVPGNLPADRLILDYLSRVAAASNLYLAKGKRIAFVGTTRKRIEREVGAAGMADPARVREVLAGFGEPEDLVKAERARLDAERDKRLSRNREAAADPAALTTPLQFRSFNSRRRPIAPPRPAPSAGEGDTGQQERPASRPGATGEGKRKSRFGGLLLGRPDRPEAQPEARPGTQSSQPAPASPPAGAAGQAPGGADRRASGGADGRAPGGAAGQGSGGAAWWAPGGTQAPGRTVPLTPAGTGTSASGGAGTPASGEAGTQAPGEAGPRRPGGISARALSVAGSETTQQPSAGGGTTLRDTTATLGGGAKRLALAAARMARRSPLETIAILLLGMGGFLYPFPFWLLGGLLALWSRTWNSQDKWIALAGPLAIALVGTVVATLIIGGWSHAASMYPHAFRLTVGYLLRAGCVLCAVYLTVQARRGPQRRLPPWKR